MYHGVSLDIATDQVTHKRPPHNIVPREITNWLLSSYANYRIVTVQDLGINIFGQRI